MSQPVIRWSVGRAGRNDAADVRIVQRLLNRDYNKIWIAGRLVSEGGRIDAHTIDAIIQFQRNAIGMKQPDGLVTPNARTWTNLVRGVRRTATPRTQQTPARPTVDLSRYHNCIQFMFDEMRNNAAGDTVATIGGHNEAAAPGVGDYIPVARAAKLARKGLAVAMWVAKVRAGADWDHKPRLLVRLRMRETRDFHFPIEADADHEYYYDIWSNIHFGYVGRAAGFTAAELQRGAASILTVLSGRQDAMDVETVQIGIELWDRLGGGLERRHILQAILNRRQRMLQVQETPAYLNTIAEEDRGWWRHIIPLHNGW